MSRFRGEYIADRKALHNTVRAAANNRCVRCGHPEGDTMRLLTDLDAVCGYETHQSAIVRDAGDGKWRVFLLRPCTDHCTHPQDKKLRILTVHHLDGNKANNAWWNLLALCQVCHLQVQGKVIPERPYLWRHSDWFVPYVCGFYAHYYGEQSITREQADATPDRWLAMGQPWLYEATP